nr:cytochrome c oxidase subunit II [Lutraria rhynchaena]
MSSWGQFGLMDPKTINAANLVLYHDLVLVVISGVLMLVGWFLVIFLSQKVFFKGHLNRQVKGNELLEVTWTITPSFFLFGLGLISLVNLYQMELGSDVTHSVEVHGHQWYWDYNYLVGFGDSSLDQVNRDEAMESVFAYCLSTGELSSLLGGVDASLSAFGSELILYCRFYMHFVLSGIWSVKSESYLVPEESLSVGADMKSGFRKQDVTTPCFLVYGEKNEIKVSTSDVMHSWGLPELGAKVDAIPGRVNCLGLIPFEPGYVSGFCYELCGPGHNGMPISAFIFNKTLVDAMLSAEVFNSEESSWEEVSGGYNSVYNDYFYDLLLSAEVAR